MKNLFYLLILALPICLGACSDDDEKGINSQIVGSWYIGGINYYDEITFYDNGTVKSSSKYKGEEPYYDKGNYRVEIEQTDEAGEKGVVYIEWPDEQCICDYSVIGNELVWQMRGEEGYTSWSRK